MVHKFETTAADKASWDDWRSAVPEAEVVDRLYQLVSRKIRHLLHIEILTAELARRERPLEALHFARVAFNIRKNTQNARNLAFLCFLTGAFDEGTSVLEKMRDNDVSPGVCLTLLALAQQRAGQVLLAVDVMREALTKPPLDLIAGELAFDLAVLSRDEEFLLSVVESFPDEALPTNVAMATRQMLRQRLVRLLAGHAASRGQE